MWFNHATFEKKTGIVFGTKDFPRTDIQRNTIIKEEKDSCFWDLNTGPVVNSFDSSKTVTTGHNLRALGNLRKANRRKTPGLLSQCPNIFHENARPHTANECVTVFCATAGKLKTTLLWLLTRSAVNFFPLDHIWHHWMATIWNKYRRTVEKANVSWLQILFTDFFYTGTHDLLHCRRSDLISAATLWRCAILITAIDVPCMHWSQNKVLRIRVHYLILCEKLFVKTTDNTTNVTSEETGKCPWTEISAKTWLIAKTLFSTQVI